MRESIWRCTAAEKHGWNNPLVAHYGIMDIPAMWLIDQNGNVVSTTVSVQSLKSDLDKLFDPAAPELKAETTAAAKSADDPPRESILERPRELQKKKAVADGQPK